MFRFYFANCFHFHSLAVSNLEPIHSDSLHDSKPSGAGEQGESNSTQSFNVQACKQQNAHHVLNTSGEEPLQVILLNEGGTAGESQGTAETGAVQQSVIPSVNSSQQQQPTIQLQQQAVIQLQVNSDGGGGTLVQQSGSQQIMIPVDLGKRHTKYSMDIGYFLTWCAAIVLCLL